MKRKKISLALSIGAAGVFAGSSMAFAEATLTPAEGSSAKASSSKSTSADEKTSPNAAQRGFDAAGSGAATSRNASQAGAPTANREASQNPEVFQKQAKARLDVIGRWAEQAKRRRSKPGESAADQRALLSSVETQLQAARREMDALSANRTAAASPEAQKRLEAALQDLEAAYDKASSRLDGS